VEAKDDSNPAALITEAFSHTTEEEEANTHSLPAIMEETENPPQLIALEDEIATALSFHTEEPAEASTAEEDTAAALLIHAQELVEAFTMEVATAITRSFHVEAPEEAIMAPQTETTALCVLVSASLLTRTQTHPPPLVCSLLSTASSAWPHL
jgi:hypothetical protein